MACQIYSIPIFRLGFVSFVFRGNLNLLLRIYTRTFTTTYWLITTPCLLHIYYAQYKNSAIFIYLLQLNDLQLFYGLATLVSLMEYESLMRYSMTKFDWNNLHTVIWFQVFISNTNNIDAIKQLQVTIPI